MFKSIKHCLFGNRVPLNLCFNLNLRGVLSRRSVLLLPTGSVSRAVALSLPSAIDHWACINAKRRAEQLGGIDWKRIPWTIVSRAYAKKGKEGQRQSAKKGKADKPHVHLSDEEIGEVIDLAKMKQQMDMTLDYLKKEYAEQLTVRTSVGILDKIVVETPEGKFPLIQLGQVIQKNPQLMMINLAATPQYISCVKVAILGSGINVNPQQEGTTIYIPIPKVTREHREGLAKNAKVLCEKTKDKLRNIQNNFTRDLKKIKDEHSEDLIFNVHETVLITTKKYMDEADSIMNAKQSDLLGKQ